MKYVKAKINDSVFERLIRLKIDDGYEKKSWSEWLDHLSRKIDLFPTDSKIISKGTSGLYPLWMKNFADNIPFIRDGNTIRKLVRNEPAKPPKHRIIIVGRGPTIFKHKHLKMLADSSYEGEVLSTDGMLIECLKAGVIPNYVSSLDGSPVCKKWFDHDLIVKYAPQIKVLLCSQVSHKTYEQIEKLGFDVYWFNPNYDDVNVSDSLTKMQLYMTISEKNPSGSLGVECRGNVGAFSIIFSWSALKKTDICLIGFDMGYPVDMPLEETYYYRRAVDSIGLLQANTNYERVFHPIFKTESHIDPVFKQYRSVLLDAIYKKPKLARVVNATEGGTLWHPQLICTKFEDWLNDSVH